MVSAPLESVTIHGHEVSFRRAGEGPTVLLIHGMAGSSRSWKEVFGILARDHDVIAPDLLGHGESDKPRGDYSLGAFASGIRDLLATLDVAHATIVGQSLGGGIALQFAYQFPEMCDRVVLVGSGGLGREVSWMLRALTLPGAEFVMPIIFPSFVRDIGDSVSERIVSTGIRSPRIAEMWRSYTSLSGTDNRQAFLRTLKAVVDPGGQVVSAHDRLYLTATMPTLIIWGDQDAIIPVEHGYAAHEAMPGSRLEIFEGGSHFVHAEEPTRFVEVLTDFIATTEADESGADHYRSILLANGEEFA